MCSCRAGAKEAFGRGFRHDPGHTYTAMKFFDACLADEDFDEAANVLASLKERHPGPLTLAREVQLAQARVDRPAAATALEQLCVTPGTDSEWPLAAADRCFTEAGWGRQAEAIFERALDRPDVLPQVAKLWAEHCAAPDTRAATGASADCSIVVKSAWSRWSTTSTRWAGPDSPGGSPSACSAIASSSGTTPDAGRRPASR